MTTLEELLWQKVSLANSNSASQEQLKVTVYSFSRVVRALKFSMAAYGSF